MKKWTIRALAMVLILCMGLTACTPAAPGTTAGSTPGTTQSTAGTTGPSEGEYELPKEEGHNQLTFYWQGKTDLSKVDMWIWCVGKDGGAYEMHPCTYGGKVVINIPQDVTEVGFIVRLNCKPGSTNWDGVQKDATDSDRFVEMKGDTTVYLKEGDTNQYFSNDGGNTLDMTKKFTMAGIMDFTTIQYNVTPAVKITSLDQVKVWQDGQQVPVTGLSSLNNKVVGGKVTVSEKLDLSKVYELEIDGYGKHTVVPMSVFDSQEFIDNYTYDGDDLGAVITGSDTTFKVWAPTASNVVLSLFAKGNDCDAYDQLTMTKGDRGVWELTVPGCGHGVYYTYTVTTAVGTQEAPDPYAKAAGLNGDRSMVVDLGRTNPDGWDSDKVVELESYTDATIWEIHVRDFSNRIPQAINKGKYLAFTEKGLKNAAGIPVGLDYLVELGVSHVHLLPVYDYATVDEANPDAQFNWGYDPKNYNVPEGSYSTDPSNGEVRILEYKQMVQALHNEGIGVIMDMVYNHTYDGNSSFNRIVPYYYYRYNPDGTNTNASGCGNDTASERYMFGKFMVDSVSYWAQEYNLDGFRFDLMGLHDLETMRKIEQAVHAINPNAIIYGEGWTMGSTINREPQANQTQIDKIETTEGAAGPISVFNDVIRDGLKGSVFDEKSQGYINGDFRANEAKVQFGIVGGGISGAAWKVTRAAVINYMSAHDNHTLWDKLTIANAEDSLEDRLAMNRLGAAIMMISQGTPFWQAGEEFLRTKDGDHNSYKSSDEINNIKWEDLTADSDEYAMALYYKGLIAMRNAYDIFRGTSDTVTVTFGKLTKGGMTATFDDGNGNRALVLINPSQQVDSFTLEGEWKLVADATRAGAEVLAAETGDVTVDAISIRVYVN